MAQRLDWIATTDVQCNVASAVAAIAIHFRHSKGQQNSLFRFVKPENKARSGSQAPASVGGFHRRMTFSAGSMPQPIRRQERALARLNDSLVTIDRATSMVVDPMINFQSSVPRARHDDQVRIDLIEELTIASADFLDHHLGPICTARTCLAVWLNRRPVRWMGTGGLPVN